MMDGWIDRQVDNKMTQTEGEYVNGPDVEVQISGSRLMLGLGIW